MKTAFIIFNEFTSLDFIGVYDPLTRLKTMGFMPDFQWDICAYNEKIYDNTGLLFHPTKIRTDLSYYDMLVISGGFGTRKLKSDRLFLNWLETSQPVPLKASVCTGSLLLGAAGFLKGKKATTHHSAYDLLAEYCKVEKQRIIEDNGVITAGGVSSGIDLGLYICEKIAGKETRLKIQKQMDYPYYQ